MAAVVTDSSVEVKRADLNRMLQSLGNVTGADLIRAAEERGWVEMRTTGSHVIYRKGGRTLPIPFNVKSDGVKRSVIRVLMGVD